MIEEFLELGSCGSAVVGHEMGLAAQVHWVQSSLLRWWRLSQFVGSSGFQKYQSLGCWSERSVLPQVKGDIVFQR